MSQQSISRIGCCYLEATVVSGVIDYSKLSLKERAALLPVPTDHYVVEYAAFCQHMGYTNETNNEEHQI